MEKQTLDSMVYDIIHFEALGEEADHLKTETEEAIKNGLLSKNHKPLITDLTVQQFLELNPGYVLPDIITTKTHSELSDDYLRQGKKKSIVTRSAGYDHFEHLDEVANIASLERYCVNAVAETAIKFAYATSGLLNYYSQNTPTFKRKGALSFMQLSADETEKALGHKSRLATVFGVGKIGKRVYDLLELNGLDVQAVDLRHEKLSKDYDGKVNFVSKEQAIATSDIIVNVMNLTKDKTNKFCNEGYFSKEVLLQAKDGLSFINVTRGNIAPESGLLELYLSGKIKGIGLDVFTEESDFDNLLNGRPIKHEMYLPDLLAAQKLVNMSLGDLSQSEIQKLVYNTIKLYQSQDGNILKEILDEFASTISQQVSTTFQKRENIFVSSHQGFNSDIAAKTKANEAIKHVISYYKNEGRGFDNPIVKYK